MRQGVKDANIIKRVQVASKTPISSARRRRRQRRLFKALTLG